MTECTKRGCRNLEWRCKDCGRVVNTAEFKDMGWISVKDRLPEENKDILAYNKDGIFTCDYSYYLREASWRVNCQCDIGEHGEHNDLNEVTHWAELPEPPKE